MQFGYFTRKCTTSTVCISMLVSIRMLSVLCECLCLIQWRVVKTSTLASPPACTRGRSSPQKHRKWDNERILLPPLANSLFSLSLPFGLRIYRDISAAAAAFFPPPLRSTFPTNKTFSDSRAPSSSSPPSSNLEERRRRNEPICALTVASRLALTD